MVYKNTLWTDKTLTVIPIKSRPPENFWKIYCFATNQIWDKNLQTATWISHNLMQNNQLAFSSMTNLQFYHFQILKLYFPISISVEAKNRYKQYWMEQTVLDEARQACLRAEQLYSLFNFFSVSTVLWIIQVMISGI